MTRNLKGERFGLLIVLEPSGKDIQGRLMWSCRCDCGVVKSIRSRALVQGQTRSCGARKHANVAKTWLGRTGSEHPKWKGGRCYSGDGYVIVYLSPYVYEFEHRIVAERMIGRELLPHEVVHHINENRADNRPENLQVMSRRDHAIEHGPGLYTGGPSRVAS